jgi:hypothetical protein
LRKRSEPLSHPGNSSADLAQVSQHLTELLWLPFIIARQCGKLDLETGKPRLYRSKVRLNFAPQFFNRDKIFADAVLEL